MKAGPHWPLERVKDLVEKEEEGWYLKLTIDDQQPEVVVISFHPLERPLKTSGGMVKP